MNSKISSIIQQIVSLIVLGILLWLLYIFLTGILSFLNSLNPQFAASLLTASMTIIISVISILTAKLLQQRYIIEQEIRTKKIPIYEKIIKFLFKIITSVKFNQKISEEEMNQFMLEITEQIIIWGSDDVVIAFNNLKKSGNIMSDGNKTTFAVEELLYAIRKDLGHKNKKLSQGMLLSLFISDDQEYITKYESISNNN